MNKDLEEYIAKRCEKALLENDEYNEIQMQSSVAMKNKDLKAFADLSVSRQILVERICYMACIKDTKEFKNDIQ